MKKVQHRIWKILENLDGNLPISQDDYDFLNAVARAIDDRADLDAFWYDILRKYG